MKLKYILPIIAFIALMPPAQAGQFEIDPQNSVILFKLPHIDGYTAGEFDKITGTLDLDETNSTLTGINSEIDTASVNTQQSQRDEDLRGSEFFDALKFPTAKFVATKIENDKIAGTLTIKGISKPVNLTYTLKKTAQDASGRTIVTLNANGSVSCKDFGIASSRTLEKGKPLLGDTVELAGQLTGILK